MLKRLAPLGAWIITGAGLLFLIWLRFYQPPNLVDDAYITFRYARNIVNGVGFVYNAGEHVLGTTTPAYTLLLALLAKLSGYSDFPRLAVVTNTLLDALAYGLVFRLAARLTGCRPAALAVALLLAIDGRLLDFGGTGGMESSFNVVASLLTLNLFFEKRTYLAMLAAGLAVLIRPDGGTLAAALLGWLGLEWLRRQRPFPWKEAGIFLGAIAPWFIFATLYFGQPIPQSILAKAVVYRLAPLTAFRAFLVQLRTLFPDFLSLPPLGPDQTLYHQLAQAALPAALCGLGLAAGARRQPRVWALGLYLIFFIAFFSAGNPLWLGWYEIPLMPVYQTLSVTGLVWLGSRLDRSVRRTLFAPLLGLAGFSLLALPQLSRFNLLPWETPRHPPFVLNATFNKDREAEYLLIAHMLQPAAARQLQVAIPEIGAFGEGYPGPIFDTTGLISPAVLKYFPIPPEIPIEIYSIPRQALLDLRPDIFVAYESFYLATLDPADPAFQALYRPSLGLTSRAAYGAQRLLVYHRADQPVEIALPAGVTPADICYDQGTVCLAGYATRYWADMENNFLELSLFWHNGPTTPQRDLLVRVNLLDRAGQLVYQVIDQPGETLFPSQSWAPDMWLVDRYQLKRPIPDAEHYLVSVTVFDSSADDPLPAELDGAPLADNTLTLSVPSP